MKLSLDIPLLAPGNSNAPELPAPNPSATVATSFDKLIEQMLSSSPDGSGTAEAIAVAAEIPEQKKTKDLPEDSQSIGQKVLVLGMQPMPIPPAPIYFQQSIPPAKADLVEAKKIKSGSKEIFCGSVGAPPNAATQSFPMSSASDSRENKTEQPKLKVGFGKTEPEPVLSETEPAAIAKAGLPGAVPKVFKKTNPVLMAEFPINTAERRVNQNSGTGVPPVCFLDTRQQHTSETPVPLPFREKIAPENKTFMDGGTEAQLPLTDSKNKADKTPIENGKIATQKNTPAATANETLPLTQVIRDELEITRAPAAATNEVREIIPFGNSNKKFVPEGHHQNSPAFQRQVVGNEFPSPEQTTESSAAQPIIPSVVSPQSSGAARKVTTNFGQEKVVPIPSGQWLDRTSESPVLPELEMKRLMAQAQSSVELASAAQTPTENENKVPGKVIAQKPDNFQAPPEFTRAIADGVLKNFRSEWHPQDKVIASVRPVAESGTSKESERPIAVKTVAVPPVQIPATVAAEIPVGKNHPSAATKQGGTGDPPVPGDNPPLGTGVIQKQNVNFGQEKVAPIPSGQSPDVTGESPVLLKVGGKFRSGENLENEPAFPKVFSNQPARFEIQGETQTHASSFHSFASIATPAFPSVETAKTSPPIKEIASTLSPSSFDEAVAVPAKPTDKPNIPVAKTVPSDATVPPAIEKKLSAAPDLKIGSAGVNRNEPVRVTTKEMFTTAKELVADVKPRSSSEPFSTNETRADSATAQLNPKATAQMMISASRQPAPVGTSPLETKAVPQFSRAFVSTANAMIRPVENSPAHFQKQSVSIELSPAPSENSSDEFEPPRIADEPRKFSRGKVAPLPTRLPMQSTLTAGSIALDESAKPTVGDAPEKIAAEKKGIPAVANESADAIRKTAAAKEPIARAVTEFISDEPRSIRRKSDNSVPSMKSQSGLTSAATGQVFTAEGTPSTRSARAEQVLGVPMDSSPRLTEGDTAPPALKNPSEIVSNESRSIRRESDHSVPARKNQSGLTSAATGQVFSSRSVSEKFFSEPIARVVSIPNQPSAEFTHTEREKISNDEPDAPVFPAGKKPAKQEPPMKFTEERNKFAGSALQNLPQPDFGGKNSEDSAAETKTDFPRLDHKEKFSSTSPAVDWSGALKPFDAVKTFPFDANRVLNSALAQVDQLSRLVGNEVFSMKQSGAQSITVSLKIDARTEISLGLTNHDGRVHASIQCERGDLSGVQNHWSQLQDSLARHNVELLPLQQTTGNRTPLPNSSPSAAFNFDQPAEHNREQSRFFSREEFFPGSLLENNKSNKPGRSGARRGWESWA